MQMDIQELVSLNFLFRHIMERIFLVPHTTAAFNELTGAQLKIMHFLDVQGPQKMSDLARLVAVGTPAATAIVDKMVRQEIVSREVDPHDRRVVRVSLTPKGVALVEQLRRVHEKRLEEFLEKLEPKKRQELVAAFARIYELLNEIEVFPAPDTNSQ